MNHDQISDDAQFARFKDAWSLDPQVTYLNHGSFGPPPMVVLKARHEWLNLLSANPMDFFVRHLGTHLADARLQLARFVGAASENLVFVENASTAMNSVADSWTLKPNDEVLTTDHDYGAVHRLWQRACDRAKARLVVQPVPVPVESAEQVVQSVLSGVTARTRLVVLSHVTSPTAIVFPVEQLCRELRDRGLPVCIDGPHALALRPLELDQLGCDYYAASCHKWLSAPFGSGFLYVHPRRQAELQPSVMSWGRPLEGDASSWRDEFNWVGTRDPAAFLAVSDALRYLEDVGWRTFRERTHRLARYARQEISAVTGLPPLVPDSPDWYGSMIALPLPQAPGRPAGIWTHPDALQTALWTQYGMEVPVMSWNGQRLLRVSCHLYNTYDQIDRLTAALTDLLAREQRR